MNLKQKGIIFPVSLKMGIDKERLLLAWISVAEGEKIASKIKQMKEIIDGVSQKEIKKHGSA